MNDTERLDWLLAEEGRTWSTRGDLLLGPRFIAWYGNRKLAGEGDSPRQAIDDAIRKERQR